MDLTINLQQYMINTVHSKLKKIITESAIRREMIITSHQTRGIGKTTSLIEFAKEYNIPVVLHYNSVDEWIREFDYKNIYSETNARKLQGSIHPYCVTDEMVRVNIIKDYNIEVITGFVFES